MDNINERLDKAREQLAKVPISNNARAIAFDLYRKDQAVTYWRKKPNPLRPVGWVPYEVARQSATFLAPLSGILASAYVYGSLSLVLSVPAALLTGYLLDKQLKHAVKKALDNEMNLDRGRFEGTHRLAQEIGIPPEKITYEMVALLAYEYKRVLAQYELDVLNKQKAEVINRAAIKQATRNMHERQASGKPVVSLSGKPRYATRASTTGVAVAAPSLSFADVADADGVIHPAHIAEIPDIAMVNPASGLPMSSIGFGVDVAGNPLGLDYNS